MADHVLAPYWAVKHRRASDYGFFTAINPPVVKIMDGGKPDYEWVYKNLPGSVAVMRDWLIDDNNGEVWKSCMKDPVATGKRVAQQMIATAQSLGVDPKRSLLMGPTNEPHVWEDGGREAATKSTIAFADELAVNGWKGLLLNLSVGWPRNMGKDLPPRWDEFPGVESAIQRGGHTLGLHEYWPETGVDKGWGWLAGRALKCTWQVPIIIGECGMSYAVTRQGIPTVDQGWQKHISDETYAAQIVDYHNRMVKDSRIKGLCLFLCDYANAEWWSKDVEPAYDNIIARRGQLNKPATKPVPVPVPTPTPPKPPLYPLTGKVASTKPNDGTTYVYGQAPVGSVVYFSWRGAAEPIAAIQSGPHPGYDAWKPGYYSIPLYVKGVTPAVGDWDVWATLGVETSPRVQFHTDGKGGKSNQVEVNFVLNAAPVPVPVPTPTPTPPVVESKLEHPVKGARITQHFYQNPKNYERFGLPGHNGTDFGIAQGTPILSIYKGVVTWVDLDKDYGNYVRVWHEELGVWSFYAHMVVTNVKQGDQVARGQVLGQVGSTGNSTGPHLHLEIRSANVDGSYNELTPMPKGRVDPESWCCFHGLKL